MGYDIIDIGHMNSLIHTQIKSYIGRGDGVAQDYDELNVDEQIANIEPKLWNAIRTMTRSKSEVHGTSKLDNPTSQAHTDLSLPQTAGHTDLSLSLSDYWLHRALSPSDCWPHRALSLRLWAAQSSLFQTMGRTELSLPQTAGCTELSLPQTAGCTELSPSDYGPHKALSLRLWATQSSLSLRLLAAQSSLSLRLWAAQSSLSLRLWAAQSYLSLISSYIMYTPLEALHMNQHACSTTAQPTYHKTVLSRTKGQIICSEETILAAELHQETRQHSSYYTKVWIHQV